MNCYGQRPRRTTNAASKHPIGVFAIKTCPQNTVKHGPLTADLHGS